MNIARALGAVAIFAAVAIGIASSAWAGGPTTPTSPTVPAPAAPVGELSGTYTFTVEIRKHHYMDDHTVWPGMRQRRRDEFVGRERALQRASAVGGRSLEHDGCPARCPNVRRQQPSSGNDRIFMGRGNTRRHSLQPRGPRYVWQGRPQRFPWSYFRVHIDESRLSESFCSRPVIGEQSAPSSPSNVSTECTRHIGDVRHRIRPWLQGEVEQPAKRRRAASLRPFLVELPGIEPVT